MEHWHYDLDGTHKAVPHIHKGGHKKHEHRRLVEYGRTYESLRRNQYRDFK